MPDAARPFTREELLATLLKSRQWLDEPELLIALLKFRQWLEERVQKNEFCGAGLPRGNSFSEQAAAYTKALLEFDRLIPLEVTTPSAGREGEC